MDTYLAASVSWANALCDLMGYPVHAPGCGTLQFTTSGQRDAALLLQLAQLSADLGRDVVHIVLGGDDPCAPTELLLAIRRRQTIDVVDARLFCAGAGSPIELFTGERRWFVGERSILTSAALPMAAKRSAGEARAWRLWRNVVGRLPQPPLTGGQVIRAGERYADAIPTESLRVTA
jgi:hypothetical protein